jgi:ketosteroid isomerase-like protein
MPATPSRRGAWPPPRKHPTALTARCPLPISSAGPAGLTAAVYASSEGLSTLVVERLLRSRPPLIRDATRRGSAANRARGRHPRSSLRSSLIGGPAAGVAVRGALLPGQLEAKASLRGRPPRPDQRILRRAMSQENVEIVRDAAAAFNRGDLDAWFEYLADDIDYRAVEGALDDRGPMHGKDAVRTHFQDWLDTFDDLRAEPLELIDAADEQVVTVLRFGGRAKLSGVETDLTFAVAYTIRDGKIARGREYWTKEQALEAAGLRE